MTLARITRALLREILRRLLGLHDSWAAYSAEYDAAARAQRAERLHRQR